MPIEKLLAYWQLHFGLRDWLIELKVCRASAFGDHNTLGDCDCFTTKRKAVIRVLDSVDHEDGQDDQETILVHELLHVLFPPRILGKKANEDRTNERNNLYEQGIDQLARTLVALSRKADA
jgi:hypothetical protein